MNDTICTSCDEPCEEAETNEKGERLNAVHRDISPKPGYTAYAALIRARPAGSKTTGHAWRTGDVYHPSWQRPHAKPAVPKPGKGRSHRGTSPTRARLLESSPAGAAMSTRSSSATTATCSRSMRK